jgi:hypothetical protein
MIEQGWLQGIHCYRNPWDAAVAGAEVEQKDNERLFPEDDFARKNSKQNLNLWLLHEETPKMFTR